ncbi:basic leucine zipper 25 [Striga asiatica]|uniref:Basic leucine zipper 25 n=1 Tax=Striga asiatica TaxID=4170 RepID=A0A5A7QN56_STRAF|nr:basic leucine zipper 25 [Striga asiatica]
MSQSPVKEAKRLDILPPCLRNSIVGSCVADPDPGAASVEFIPVNSSQSPCKAAKRLVVTLDDVPKESTSLQLELTLNKLANSNYTNSKASRALAPNEKK